MEVRGRTIQQLSPKKIAFAEQVPVQCSLSEAFHVRSNSDSIQMMNSWLHRCLTWHARWIFLIQCPPNGDCIKRTQQIYIPPEWARSPNGHDASVDGYWSRVATQKDGLGNPMYLNLMLVVRAALCISHGQANVERGFSINKMLSTKHELTWSSTQYRQFALSKMSSTNTRKWNKYQSLVSWFVDFVVHMQLTLNIYQRSRKKLQPVKNRSRKVGSEPGIWISAAEEDRYNKEAEGCWTADIGSKRSSAEGCS